MYFEVFCHILSYFVALSYLPSSTETRGICPQADPIHRGIRTSTLHHGQRKLGDMHKRPSAQQTHNSMPEQALDDFCAVHRGPVSS